MFSSHKIAVRRLLLHILFMIQGIITLDKVKIYQSKVSMYNFYFYLVNNLTIQYNSIDFFDDKLENNFKSKIYSNSLRHAHLLNLKIGLKKLKINTNDYNFIDIGSGNGVVLYYIAKNYDFKFHEGIEFEIFFNDVAKKNLQKYSNNIKLEIKDASTYLLKNQKYIIYIFNSFTEQIFEKFIQNNISNIKKNKSIILYQGGVFENYFLTSLKKKYNLNFKDLGNRKYSYYLAKFF